MGLGILFKEFQQLNEIQTLDRVAADAHTGALGDASAGALPHRLIGQRSATGDDADVLSGAVGRLMNIPWHNSNLARPRGDDAGGSWDR